MRVEHTGDGHPRLTRVPVPGVIARVTTAAPAPLVVAAVAFLAYATTLPQYELRVTDLSGWRISHGDVPYRDFWTMYAPGSFVTLGAVFATFGQELIISRLLGMLTAAAAVGAYFRLARVLVGEGDGHRQPARMAVPSGSALLALLPTLVFAATFFGTGYYAGFGSYPPAIFAIWLAVHRLARFAADGRTRDLVVAGAYLGAGLLFKHDVAGYALLVAVVALLLQGDRHRRSQLRFSLVRVPLVLMATAGAIVALPLAVLLLLGAGPDMVRDLVTFPLTDFRHVRAEYFPLVPRLRPDLVGMAREAVRWTTCNLPTMALLAGLLALWRRRRALTAAQRFVLAFLVVAFPLYWMAAHVQINTHAVTLAGIGALVGAAGLAGPWTRAHRRPVVTAVSIVVAAWCATACLERGYVIAERVRSGMEPIALPRLAGISAPPATAAWMRGLAREIAGAAGPEAGLLVLGNRNDVLVYADTTPYWLSPRHPATRYQELHPAVTDTEAVQREMLADLARQPLPVVVREHRFDPAGLETVKAQFLRHVPVGATLVDGWVATNYTPGPRFGLYEVMRLRIHAEGPSSP